MLNSISKKSIVDSLDFKGFSSTDFLIEEKEEEEDEYNEGIFTILTIKLAYSTQCEMFISIPNNNSNNVTVTYAPGVRLDRETKTASFAGITSAIKEWLTVVTKELMNASFAKIIEHRFSIQEELIADLNAKLDAMEMNENFSEEEKVSIEEKLSQLENDIQAELEKLKEEKNELYKDMQKMQEEITLLQNTLNTTDKKSWLKAFAIKVMNWTSKPQNRQLLYAGVKLASTALPQSVQDIVNSDATEISG